MALKDWKKREIKDIGLEFSKDYKKILVSVRKENNYKGRVEIFNKGKYEFDETFKTKSQAISYAKNYMREN